MVKKPAAKKSTAKKSPAKKSTTKKKPAKKVERVEIQLDPVETKAFELAHASEEVRRDLEEAVTLAMSETVRKVFKKHRLALTAEQAQEVALLLFGD
jgi:hypothetical protein